MLSSRLRMLVPLVAGLLTPLALGLAPPLNAPKVKARPFRFPKPHGKAELKYVNGVPVLTVAGTPDEIGTAVGTLALKPARRVLTYPKGLLDYFSAGFLWKTALAKGKEMAGHFPAGFRTEWTPAPGPPATLSIWSLPATPCSTSRRWCCVRP